MNLQDGFNTIVNTVAITPLTKQERINVEEALKVVVVELNAYDKIKNPPKKDEPDVEETPDETKKG